jgi:hypothetical protein
MVSGSLDGVLKDLSELGDQRFVCVVGFRMRETGCA